MLKRWKDTIYCDDCGRSWDAISAKTLAAGHPCPSDDCPSNEHSIMGIIHKLSHQANSNRLVSIGTNAAVSAMVTEWKSRLAEGANHRIIDQDLADLIKHLKAIRQEFIRTTNGNEPATRQTDYTNQVDTMAWDQYRVVINRISHKTCTVFINGASPEEANTKALAVAGDQDFSTECSCEYEVEATERDNNDYGKDILDGHPKLNVLTEVGYDVDTDSDQPGKWIWTRHRDGCDSSYHSAVEALNGAWADAASRTMNSLNISVEQWNIVPFDKQKQMITDTLGNK